jgi:hypothetical protein
MLLLQQEVLTQQDLVATPLEVPLQEVVLQEAATLQQPMAAKNQNRQLNQLQIITFLFHLSFWQNKKLLFWIL